MSSQQTSNFSREELKILRRQKHTYAWLSAFLNHLLQLEKITESQHRGMLAAFEAENTWCQALRDATEAGTVDTIAELNAL